MRERLTLAFTVLLFSVLTVFLVVRGYASSDLISAQEHDRVERTATMLALLVAESDGELGPADLSAVLEPGERVEYVDAAGDRMLAGRDATGRPLDADALADALAGADPSSDDLVERRPVAGGGTITLTRTAEVVDDRIADALFPLVALVLALALVGVALAVLFARHLARPFRELADVAGEIGRGNLDVTVPSYPMPEADAVGRVLRTAARDLESLVDRERHFATNASHELRTPITALRLELEDLAMSPKTPPDVVDAVSSALGQLDRLSASVAHLLDATRAHRVDAMVEIDLAALLHDTVDRWRTLASSHRILDGFTQVVPVRLPAGSLVQVMDVLIGNAVTHGEGTITVSIAEREGYVEVLVADEGARAAVTEGVGHPVASGGGGLAEATRIAQSLGGHLRLTEAEHTTFSLVLPRVRQESIGS
jgi:signal transduction histidine kinase